MPPLAPSPITLHVRTPLRLPRVWRALLRRCLTMQTPPTLGNTRADDPASYRDDLRIVRRTTHGIAVIAELISSQEGYWFSWGVYRPEADGTIGERLNYEDDMHDTAPRTGTHHIALLDGGHCAVTVAWH